MSSQQTKLVKDTRLGPNRNTPLALREAIRYLNRYLSTATLGRRKEVGRHDQLRRIINGCVREEVSEDDAVEVLTKTIISNLRIPENLWEDHAPAIREALQMMKRNRQDATAKLKGVTGTRFA